MRNIKRFLIVLAAAVTAFSFTSCEEDTTLEYYNVTMGNVVDGVFVSDQGNIFNVVEQTCVGRVDTMKRALVICDVLKAVEGKENEYDVRLNFLTKVMEKQVLPLNGIEDFTKYVNDPLILSDWWISGGYINMYVTLPVDRNAKKIHEINLVHEFSDDTHKFFLRHNANGDLLKDGGDNSAFDLASTYISFPISSVINADKAKVVVEWNSLKVMGTYVSAQSETKKYEFDYERNKYEHVPSNAVSGMSALSLD